VVIEDPIGTADVAAMREAFPELGKCMMGIAARAEQSEYRRAEETTELAGHDTELMLTVLKLNENLGEHRDRVLGSKAYVVTASSRYVRVASQCKIDTSVSASPHVLTGLLEMMSPSSISDRQFVALFENPLLQQVAEACWDDLLILIDAGVQLRGKSITRLRHDCEQSFQASITAMARTGETDTAGIVRAYAGVADQAASLGYKLGAVLRRFTRSPKHRRKESPNC